MVHSVRHAPPLATAPRRRSSPTSCRRRSTRSRPSSASPVLRLSANENPIGPSPLAVAAIRREAERIHLYPDGGAPALAEAVADSLGVAPGQLIFGNGGDEILTLLGRALLDPGDEVVVPDPSFEPYTTTALLAGAKVVTSPLRDYRIDLDDVLARDRAAHQARVPVESPQSDGDGARPGRLGAVLRALPRRRRGAPRRGVRRLHRGARPAPRTGWRRSGRGPRAWCSSGPSPRSPGWRGSASATRSRAPT